MRRQHAPQDGQPAAAGQVHVEEHDVGQALADELDGGGRLVGLAHDVDGVPELGLHAGAEHGMVLDQEDAWAPPDPQRSRRGRSLHPFAPGHEELDLGPSPGAERMTASPPKRATRDSIDWAMPRRSAGTDAGSKPWPRSRT